MPEYLVSVLSRTVIYTHRLPRPELLLFFFSFCASRLILRDCPFWPVLSIGLHCAVYIFFSPVFITLHFAPSVPCVVFPLRGSPGSTLPDHRNSHRSLACPRTAPLCPLPL